MDVLLATVYSRKVPLRDVHGRTNAVSAGCTGTVRFVIKRLISK